MSAGAAPCAIPGTPLADARAGLDACVHCGFCLQACPTYTVFEDENDNPRGRVLLMRALVEGALPTDDPDVRTHLDRCLGCRACETACPSGVPYGHLLEAARATLTTIEPPPLVARLTLAVFEREWLLRPALFAARLLRATGIPAIGARLGGRVGSVLGMIAATRPAIPRRRYTPRGRRDRGRVATLTGCVMEGLFSHVNRATDRVLVVNDYDVVPATGQVCCGALHAHAGDREGARALARANIEAFERAGVDLIAVNSAGCGAMMKEYGELLADDPTWAARATAIAAKVRDVSELLAAAGPRRGGWVGRRVTYDAPCHLLHAQRIVTPPLQVLEAAGGMELVPLRDADRCCGAAGIYSLVEPSTSRAVLAPKLDAIAESGAEVVATGNPGCLMQIGAGLRHAGSRVRVAHPVELLDASYARADET